MFDNWKDSLKRGFDGLKDRAEQLQESMRLKSAMEQLQQQKANRLLRLGALAYHALRGSQPLGDGAAEEAKAILALDIQLAPLKHQLALVESGGKAPCPNCATMLEASAAFCGKCGTDLAKARAAQPACHACTTPLSQSDQFCGNCGSKVGGAA